MTYGLHWKHLDATHHYYCLSSSQGLNLAFSHLVPKHRSICLHYILISTKCPTKRLQRIKESLLSIMPPQNFSLGAAINFFDYGYCRRERGVERKLFEDRPELYYSALWVTLQRQSNNFLCYFKSIQFSWVKKMFFRSGTTVSEDYIGDFYSILATSRVSQTTFCLERQQCRSDKDETFLSFNITLISEVSCVILLNDKTVLRMFWIKKCVYLRRETDETIDMIRPICTFWFWSWSWSRSFFMLNRFTTISYKETYKSHQKRMRRIS